MTLEVDAVLEARIRYRIQVLRESATVVGCAASAMAAGENLSRLTLNDARRIAEKQKRELDILEYELLGFAKPPMKRRAGRSI